MKLGSWDGCTDGAPDRITVGKVVGRWDGSDVGSFHGSKEGTTLGSFIGAIEGRRLGISVETTEGRKLGISVGTKVGIKLGKKDGMRLGPCDFFYGFVISTVSVHSLHLIGTHDFMFFTIFFQTSREHSKLQFRLSQRAFMYSYLYTDVHGNWPLQRQAKASLAIKFLQQVSPSTVQSRHLMLNFESCVSMVFFQLLGFIKSS